MGYTFNIEYRKTEDFGQADGLSRLPLKSKDLFDQFDFGMNVVINRINAEIIAQLPVSAKHITEETAKDVVLSTVKRYMLNGFPNKLEPEYVAFARRKNELSECNGCLMYANRTIIPKSLQPAILKYLHATHAGIVRMKSEARGHCWWPEIDKDLEKVAADCKACTLSAKQPVKVPLQQ